MKYLRFVQRVVAGTENGGNSMLRKFAGLVATSALALGLASAANATDFHVGDLPNFYLTSGSPFGPSVTANFGNGFDTQTNFDDSYFFTIPTQSGLGSGSISTSFSSLVNKLTIDQLYVNGALYTVPSNSSGQSLSLSGVPITAGVQNVIRVVGTTSSQGGTYSGTLTFAAVPEPASWLMMVGGFGLMGAAMRRRKTSLSFA